jgi:hypothetical protein
VTSRPGLRGWNNPLKGGTPRVPPAWKRQDGEGRKKVAGRLRKPESDTVASGMGPAGRDPGNRVVRRETGGTWTPFSQSAEGARNPRRGARGREARGGDFGTYREGGSNPRRGSSEESLPWTGTAKGIPAGLDVQRASRPNREQVTDRPATSLSDNTLQGTMTPRRLGRTGDGTAWLEALSTL